MIYKDNIYFIRIEDGSWFMKQPLNIADIELIIYCGMNVTKLEQNEDIDVKNNFGK